MIDARDTGLPKADRTMTSQSPEGPYPNQLNRAISFVLPAYNEEENITKAIDDTVDIPVRQRSAFVIVVDDGSSDRAAELVAQRAVRCSQIRVVAHPCYLGHRTSGSLATVEFNRVAVTAG